ncbi:hypothetical protein EJ02DRAFT_453002 [Clathrospora elynae]|uniref:PHD-type domain-containing protein n=1 Tax=Clathrospora elynae TaxID=706981 RepID=A0A6A5SVI5_9PLEO|nr:hypothetical protein EJ02DRAFT_453002 [Clathrospora elynae]
MGEGELLGQIDGVMMEVYQDLDMPDLDGEHEEEHDEVQQEEVASSGEIIMAEQEDTREHGEVQQGEISSVDLPEAIMVEQKDVQEHKEVQQEDLLSSDMPETFMTQDQDTYGQTPEPHPQVLDSAALNVEMADSAPLDLLTPQKEHIQHSKSPEPILSPRWTSPAPEVADEVIVAARNTPPASSRHTSPLLPSRHNTPRVKEEDVTAIATNLSEEAPTGLPGGSEEAPVIHLDFDEEAPAFHPDADQQAPFIYPDADHLNFDDEALIIHPDVDEEAPLINPDADEEVTITDTDIDQDASIVYLGTDEEASPKIVAPDQDAESIAEEAEATSQFCVEGCGGDDAGPMIACDSNCTRQWFHYPCVGLTDATNPRGGWHCPSCRPAATPKKRSRRSAANTDQKMHSHQATEDKIRARGTGEPKYCIKLCLSPANNNMIACDANCSQAWFHFECVGLKTSTVPEGSWYCPGCRLKEERQAKARALRRRG